jgi:hypothetical protein
MGALVPSTPCHHLSPPLRPSLLVEDWTDSVLRLCLDHVKNSVRIEELRIISEDIKKIVIFRLLRR